MKPATISFSELILLVALFAAFMIIVIAFLILVLRKRRSKVVTFDAMHISEVIKLIISAGSFITVCITLILLVLQNHTIVTQTNYALESAKSQVFGLVTTYTLSTDEIFVRYPELRPYFYQGKEIQASDPQYPQVLAVAEYLLDYFDSLETHLKKYPQLWFSEEKTWEGNTMDMFAWSPILCRYLEGSRNWFSDDLYRLKEAGEEKRRQGFVRQVLPGQ
jgi:hypothetical protein